MKRLRSALLAIVLSVAVFWNCAASAEGDDCNASVIDVTTVRAGEEDAEPAADVYAAITGDVAVDSDSVFRVFRPSEVNDHPKRHYPLMMYVGRLRVVEVQDEILIGRMIELASASEHPRLRHEAVMLGDCLRLEVDEEALPSVAPQELPAEVLDLSALKFPGARAAEPDRIIPLKILFQFDSAVVEEKWSDELALLADYIERERPARVIIEGHACWIGTAEYNRKLSERRARAVIDYLANRHGFDRNIFDVEAYGESLPEVSNETRAGRKKNRRAAASIFIKVVPTTNSPAASPDWPLAVEPEELAPEDVELPKFPTAALPKITLNQEDL